MLSADESLERRVERVESAIVYICEAGGQFTLCNSIIHTVMCLNNMLKWGGTKAK
jgi:hypothetical protein